MTNQPKINTPAGVAADAWEDVLSQARNVFEHRDEACWALGQLVDALVKDTQPADEKPAARRKRVRGLIKALATGIKMPNSNTLHGYYRTYAFYPPRVQDNYPNLSYSHFREAAKKKHGLSQSGALEYLEVANELDDSVAVLRREITHEARAPKRETRRFKVTLSDPHIPTTRMLDMFPEEHYESIVQLIGKPGATFTLVVEVEASS